MNNFDKLSIKISDYGRSYYVCSFIADGSFGGHVFKLPGFEGKIAEEKFFISCAQFLLCSGL